MRWLDRIPWFRGSPTDGDALDIDAVLAEGLRDPASARRASALLRRERQALLRQRKDADRRSGLLTPSRVQTIIRPGYRSPGMEAYQLSRAMREASASDQAATLRGEQLAAIEERIRAVDGALAQLKSSRG